MNIEVFLVLLLCVAILIDLVVIAVSDVGWLRIVAALLLVLNCHSLFVQIERVPGTQATRADMTKLINQCEATLPRNEKCIIELAPVSASSANEALNGAQ